MNKRTVCIILAIILFAIEPLLMGSGIFKVGLRNTDPKNDPLVKIDELIGGNNMPDPPNTPQTEETQTEEEKSEEPSDEAVEKEQEPEDTSITVSIMEKTISINNSVVPAEEFEKKIETLYDGSREIILEDAFAEYHTYENVLSIFDKNHIKYKEIILNE